MASPWASTLMAVALVLATAAWLSEAGRLESHRHLRCSACRAIIDFIGDEMNETAKTKESVKMSHRVTKGDKRWKKYEETELRAVEIMEKVCKDIEGKYPFRQGEDGVRTFSKNSSLSNAKKYSKKEHEELDDIQKKLKDICYELTDEYDEPLTKLIQKVRQLEELEVKFCNKTAKVCGTKAEADAIAFELKRKAKYDKREADKEAKRKARIEADKKKREEEEAARKAAEENKATGETAEEAKEAAEKAQFEDQIKQDTADTPPADDSGAEKPEEILPLPSPDL